MHPFLDGISTCARAVWKHPGKHNQAVQLKGPHKCKGDDYSVAVQRPTSTLAVAAPAQSTVTSLVVAPTLSTPAPTETVVIVETAVPGPVIVEVSTQAVSTVYVTA